jgi:hypothetical protein
MQPVMMTLRENLSTYSMVESSNPTRILQISLFGRLHVLRGNQDLTDVGLRLVQVEGFAARDRLLCP